jgi:hypothetical protein
MAAVGIHLEGHGAIRKTGRGRHPYAAQPQTPNRSDLCNKVALESNGVIHGHFVALGTATLSRTTRKATATLSRKPIVKTPTAFR